MRALTIFIASLAAGTCLGQDQLVLTRLLQEDVIEPDETLQLDLKRYFQYYEESGPIATFIIDMPELDDREIFVGSGTNRTSIVTYRLQDGGTYENPYNVGGADYIWNRHLIEFQLLAKGMPITVANFMTYAADGAYENTIVHRNESTGEVFRPGQSDSAWASAGFLPFPILQAGAYRLYSGEEYVLEAIETAPPIPLEGSGLMNQGTLAMARATDPDSATSQFFINLNDNGSIIQMPYAVFGQLVEPMQDDLPTLLDFANTPVYNLTAPYTDGAENIFPNLPFQAIPLYAPFPYEKESYARITSIHIPEGDPEGVTYSYDWVTAGDVATEEELKHQSVFDVELDGADLKISRHNTGQARLRVTGTGTQGDHAEFEIELTAYNEPALDIFPSAVIHHNGWIEDGWYGWLIADSFPDIYHLNHRNQVVSEVSTFDKLYVYDLDLKTWIYTSPEIYPFMYSYSLGIWLWYQVGSGDYDSKRWFYVYVSENPHWVTEDEI